jgi:hypothetical protein
MTTLVCPECQRDNEPQRIFCHGCGARLDRSGLAQEKVAEEQTEQTRERVQRLFDPHRGRLGRIFFAFCKLILGAIAAAALVQMILPPDLPAVAQQNVGLPAQINFDLESAILYHRQVQYSQDQVNGYLAYSLKNKKASLDKPFLTFKRVLVGFSEGVCTVTVERSLFGYSVYHRASYKVNVANRKITASSAGGWVGRLPLAPQITRYEDIIFNDVWSALGRDQKLVAQLTAIEFHSGTVVLSAVR